MVITEHYLLPFVKIDFSRIMSNQIPRANFHEKVKLKHMEINQRIPAVKKNEATTATTNAMTYARFLIMDYLTCQREGRQGY